jgi:hypothetical protein
MCDFSHDGRLKTFPECQMLAAEQPLSGNMVRPIGEPVRTVHPSTNHTCRATLIQLSCVGQDTVLGLYSRVFGLPYLLFSPELPPKLRGETTFFLSSLAGCSSEFSLSSTNEEPSYIS